MQAGAITKQALSPSDKMLAYFLEQPINSKPQAMLEIAIKLMEDVVTTVVTSNELASKIKALDANLERINGLEAYVAECRKFYGANYRKEEFEYQLANKQEAIDLWTAERTNLVKQSVSNPQILSIKALGAIQNFKVEESIKELSKACLEPIKQQIEAGALTYLNRIIEKQYENLTLVEVAHVLHRFVSGEVKIYGKLGVNDLSGALLEYSRNKMNYLEHLADNLHLDQKQGRSQGELLMAMQETREALRRKEQEKQDLNDAKRWAQKEQTKQSYLQAYQANENK